jgi:hypothetical protein
MFNIKFLGIHINDSMNWRCHVESIIPKLSSACYTSIMRSIKPYMPINTRTMKTVYYSCFNTIMSYGLFLWGNLPHSLKIFRMQKKIIRIVTVIFSYVRVNFSYGSRAKMAAKCSGVEIVCVRKVNE